MILTMCGSICHLHQIWTCTHLHDIDTYIHLLIHKLCSHSYPTAPSTNIHLSNPSIAPASRCLLYCERSHRPLHRAAAPSPPPDDHSVQQGAGECNHPAQPAHSATPHTSTQTSSYSTSSHTPIAPHPSLSIRLCCTYQISHTHMLSHP